MQEKRNIFSDTNITKFSKYNYNNTKNISKQGQDTLLGLSLVTGNSCNLLMSYLVICVAFCS